MGVGLRGGAAMSDKEKVKLLDRPVSRKQWGCLRLVMPLLTVVILGGVAVWRSQAAPGHELLLGMLVAIAAGATLAIFGEA